MNSNNSNNKFPRDSSQKSYTSTTGKHRGLGRFLVALVSFVFTATMGWWFLSDQFTIETKPKVVPPDVESKRVDPSQSLRPKTPLSGQKIWLVTKEPIRFEWFGEAREDTVFEIARDPDFRMPLHEEVYPLSPHFTDKVVEDGNYFWRLSQKSASGERIPLFNHVSFAVLTLKAPVLIYPFGSFSSSDDKPIKFYWQEKKGVTQYRLQIARDKSFQSLTNDQLVSEPQTNPLQLPGGSYFWRVRAEDNLMETSQWSEIRTLSIQQSASNVAAPVKITPAPVVPTKNQPPPVRRVIVTKKMDVPKVTQKVQKALLSYIVQRPDPKKPASSHDILLNPPAMKWGKITGASGYELQVSKKPDFSELEWTDTVSGLQAKWQGALPGKYFWRVRAMRGEEMGGPFTTANTLELNLAPPRMQKVFLHKLNLSEDSTKPSVPITWSAVPGAARYRVLVGTKKNFTSAKLDLTASKATVRLPIESSGTYYVKVAVIDNDGASAGDFSSESELRVEKDKVMLEGPIAKLPFNGISIVSFNGQQDPIAFRWQGVVSAAAYRLEISEDDAFKHVTLSQVTPETQVIINKHLPRGRFYWRVRAELGVDKSEWSEVFNFEISN